MRVKQCHICGKFRGNKRCEHTNAELRKYNLKKLEDEEAESND